MKKITLLLILLTSTIYSQKYIDTLYNFRLNENKIIWQKVFETKEKDLQNTFRKKVITNIKLENLQEIDNIISFSVIEDIIDFKKYGGKWGSTAIFVQYPNNYLVVIDFKHQKYRVTIKAISLKSEIQYMATDLKDYVIKKNKIKNSKTNNKGLNYYNKHFIAKFTLKNSTNSDW